MKVSFRSYRIYYNFVSICYVMYGSGVGERHDEDCSEQVREEYLAKYPSLLPHERVIVVDEGFSIEDSE